MSLERNHFNSVCAPVISLKDKLAFLLGYFEVCFSHLRAVWNGDCMVMDEADESQTSSCVSLPSSAGQILHHTWTTTTLHPTPARAPPPHTHPMHSSQGVLLAPTRAILLDPPGPTSQASRVTKAIPSMDGRTRLHLQDQSMQMGLKTQVSLAAAVPCHRDPFWLANMWVHADLDVTWLPVSDPHRDRGGGGGGLLEGAIVDSLFSCLLLLLCL